MNQMVFLLILLFCIFHHVESISPSGQPSQQTLNQVQPGLAVVIGVLALTFSLTIVFALYAKFCNRGVFIPGSDENNQQFQEGLIRRGSRRSGLDKIVVESLPFFKFSVLRGLRGGLDCAVCLSQFEDIEILRLLPKCKHAFHIACVDQWFENHSSCPLCRRRIKVDDLTYSNSLRFFSHRSEMIEDSNMELFVQREDNRHGSSRFGIGRSFRKFDKGVIKEQTLPITENLDSVLEQNDKFLHKFNHKIIVSDVVLKRRWSNLSPSDLVSLNSEMLGDASSKRFSSLDRKRNFETNVSKSNRNNSIFPSSSVGNASNPTRFLNPNDKRAMSEITGISRFKYFNTRNSVRESSDDPENADKEEKLKRLWLPIAQKTVQLYGNRDKTSQESINTRQSLNV